MKKSWIIIAVLVIVVIWYIRSTRSKDKSSAGGGLSSNARGNSTDISGQSISLPTTGPSRRTVTLQQAPAESSDDMKQIKRSKRRKTMDEYNSGRGFLPKYNDHTL
jgi:hypothetical protein